MPLHGKTLRPRLGRASRAAALSLFAQVVYFQDTDGAAGRGRRRSIRQRLASPADPPELAAGAPRWNGRPPL